MPWSLLAFGPLGLSAGIDQVGGVIGTEPKKLPTAGLLGSACARCGSDDHSVAHCTWPPGVAGACRPEGCVNPDSDATVGMTNRTEPTPATAVQP